MRINCARVKAIRQRFQLNVQDWAKLVGVALSTAYRWEQRETVEVDPFHYDLLLLLEKLPEQDLKPVMLHDAPLKVLWRLLGQVYGEQ